MIDLTPLDVRKKRGDFRRILRGYEPEEVDTFLQLVAERMEELVKENLSLVERVERLQEQVGSMEGRERAVQDALVTAERLRSDVKEQAAREAQVVRREAESDARRILEDAERTLAEHRGALAALEKERRQFLGSFRALLQRQMERLETEEDSLGEGAPPAHGRGEALRRSVAGTVGSAAAGLAGADAPLPPAAPMEGAGPRVDAADPGEGAPGAGGGTAEGGKEPGEEGRKKETEAGRGGEDLSTWLAGFLEGDELQDR